MGRRWNGPVHRAACHIEDSDFKRLPGVSGVSGTVSDVRVLSAGSRQARRRSATVYAGHPRHAPGPVVARDSSGRSAAGVETVRTSRLLPGWLVGRRLVTRLIRTAIASRPPRRASPPHQLSRSHGRTCSATTPLVAFEPHNPRRTQARAKDPIAANAVMAITAPSRPRWIPQAPKAIR